MKPYHQLSDVQKYRQDKHRPALQRYIEQLTGRDASSLNFQELEETVGYLQNGQLSPHLDKLPPQEFKVVLAAPKSSH